MPSESPKMFNKPKSWLSGTLWRPKNPHSLEHLKFLYNLLCKNQTVTEQNRGLLVETLRSISEILIWGDQNDSSVFDFFLEKNMLSFFLRYLQQKFGRFICVQLLQTLNILFENISNETSLYYLLSNNHINSIIVHKFDFSDEEVMAYYISFLKTLSLKLNKHTIHFFYNETSQTPHTNDFALYTEAIKFFNHHESMVRIAVRTITLNVFKVDDKAMLSYIRDRTAAPYFSNLVWFIGNHILDLDTCVRHDHDHRSRDRLADLVAEHLDHLHYLNDIFLIGIDTLNQVLTDKLINRLLLPLYVYSLTKRKKITEEADDRKHVSSVVSLFLLSQVFLIIHYGRLVQQLAEVIFNGDIALSQPGAANHRNSPKIGIREFRPPRESLEKTLENSKPKRSYDQQLDLVSRNLKGGSRLYPTQPEDPTTSALAATSDVLSSPSTEGARSPGSEVCSGDTELSSPTQNSTDEEKLLGRVQQRLTPLRAAGSDNPQSSFTLDNKPYLEAIFNALECSENDYSALFALCLLYAVCKSAGISQNLLDSVLMPTERSDNKENYNLILVERLIKIIELACQSGTKVRLATLDISIKLLHQLVNKADRSYLQDRHLACIENARECCTQLLRNFYKSEEIFLDMFEDEYREMKTRPLNVEYLMQDASILLPPTGTPLTGIDFNKRLPCGEVERARRAIRVFFMVRDLSLSLMHETEAQLPLTKEELCIRKDDVLDLNNSDLIACTVLSRESRKQERRFLVIDPVQLILVEPDSKRLGWGVVKFVGFLQDVEVSGDKDDSRLLHIVVHKPQSSVHAKPTPILSARFLFDDHIRCMAAKQRLIKGRHRARQQKMAIIERLLDISQTEDRGHFARSGPIPGRSHPVRIDSRKSNNDTGSVSPLPANGSPTGAASTSSSSSKTRRVTPEQKKILQAKAAQRIKSRQEQLSVSRQEKESSCRKEAGIDSLDSSSCELGEEAASAMAFQSLNHNFTAESHLPVASTSAVRSQLRQVPGKSSEANNSCLDIPLEDLSHKNRVIHSSVERARPGALSQRDLFRFQRSLSHSPSRSTGPRLQEASTSLMSAGKVEVARRLSAPITIINPSKRNSVMKVSTATQVGNSHSNISDRHIAQAPPAASNLPVRRRFLSGPSPTTLRAADAPVVSLVAEKGNPATLGCSVNLPKLLGPGQPAAHSQQREQPQLPLGNSSLPHQNLGARPKQLTTVSAELRPELKAEARTGLTAQKLTLHSLHQIPDPNPKNSSVGTSVKDEVKTGFANSAISPETPSSDSAVSSDASMISISSKASESSMDVDSDNNASLVVSAGALVASGGAQPVSGGASVADVGTPATASQQLTQLAQMVQEHYPYKVSDLKHQTG